jgi:hypothetical protein
MSSPPWLVKAISEGKVASNHELDLVALAVLPHHDVSTMMVRKDLGITRIEDIRDRKIPLRVGIPPRGMDHPGGWIIDKVLEEYGFCLADIESWGGQVIDSDRAPIEALAVHVKQKSRIQKLRDGETRRDLRRGDHDQAVEGHDRCRRNAVPVGRRYGPEAA